MLALADFLHDSVIASDNEDLANSFVRFLNHFELESFSFTITVNVHNDIVDENFGILHNYPIEWVENYNENQFCLFDPVYIKASFCPGEVFSWSQATEEFSSRRGKLGVNNMASAVAKAISHGLVMS